MPRPNFQKQIRTAIAEAEAKWKPQRTGATFLQRHDRRNGPLEPRLAEHRDMTAEPFRASRLARWGTNMHWPEYQRDNQALEEQCERRREEISSWEDAVLVHASHPRLRFYDFVGTRELGFRCPCTEPLTELRIHLRGLSFSPPVRAIIEAASKVRYGTARTQPVMRAQREKRLAERRSRALLHQLLTREQRWSLRGRGSFLVTAGDGRTYEVTMNRGVRLIVEGRPHTSYCIHPAGDLPVYDVMLAQKLLLEADVGHFLAVANARSVRDYSRPEVQLEALEELAAEVHRPADD